MYGLLALEDIHTCSAAESTRMYVYVQEGTYHMTRGQGSMSLVNAQSLHLGGPYAQHVNTRTHEALPGTLGACETL